MGITHVIRGEDHVTNTGVQIEIFEALGAKPPAFAHMPLLVGADGEALSKRLGSLSIEQLRDGGFEPIAVLSHLGKIGTSDALEIAPDLGALAGSFDFGKMGRAPARYDSADLERLNAAALHVMPYAEAQPRLAERDADLGETFWLAIRANLTLFDGVANWARVVNGPVEPLRDEPDFLGEAARLLPETVDAGAWSAWTGAVKEATGRKGKQLFLPLRRALTGLDHGPEMGPMLQLIGRERALARLEGRTG
jgi:glutamyl-tRNA synthetase